jgi:pilus assembly protein CpaF
MSLLKRIENAQWAVQPDAAPVEEREEERPAVKRVLPSPSGAGRQGGRDEYLREIRTRLQGEVIRQSGFLAQAAPEEIRSKVEGIVDASGAALTRSERVDLVAELVAEITGYGPIDHLLKDGTITEVMVNGPDQIYIERAGKIILTPVTFRDDEHVRRVIDRIIAPLGRRIDESSPRVDARLPDGSRVNAIIPPLSLIGPVITVRKFAAKPYTVEDLVRFGTATAEMFDFLRACVEARLNMFVSGGTGSGKTTTLNVLSSFIPGDERIVTIEDAAELQLDKEHLITLEARPPNLEGLGEITIRDLLRNALHMRPDRIIVGECRGGEALDMLQAMTVGQDGSMSTGHSNSPPDMLHRLETMVLMSGYEMPLRSIREQVASAIDLIVHTARLKDGSRKITAITEVYGIEDDQILTQDIFVFQQTGVEDGKIQGILKPTGIRPTFMPKFEKSGVHLPPGEFGIPPAPVVGASGKKGKGAAGPAAHTHMGMGRAAKAGGMVYLTSVGPVDPATGNVVGVTIREQARQCLSNIKARLEAEGSSLDRIVWANWALREPGEFDSFSEEWAHWFPGDMPVGQGTIMPTLQRRAGFRVTIGVIAEAGDGKSPKAAGKPARGGAAKATPTKATASPATSASVPGKSPPRPPRPT